MSGFNLDDYEFITDETGKTQMKHKTTGEIFNGTPPVTYGANEGGDGGTGVGEGETTPTGTEPIMTYGQYQTLYDSHVAARESAYQRLDAYAKKAIAAANKQKEMSYAEADRLRGQQERDAWLSYHKSSPTYGAQGEALARNGLSRGGYSAYLEGRNYATARNEVSAAGATAARSKAAADMTYAEAESTVEKAVLDGQQAADDIFNEGVQGIQAQMIQDEKDKDVQFQTVLKEIEDGTATYTEDQIRAMGFGEEQTNALISKATEKNAAAELATSVAALSDEFAELGENFDIGKVDTLLAQEGLSDTDKQTLEGIKKTYVDNIVNDAKTVFAGGNVEDIAAVLYDADQLCAQGKISDDVRNSIYFERALAAAGNVNAADGNFAVFEKMLQGYVDSGKMGEFDAHKLKQYVMQNSGKILEAKVEERLDTSGKDGRLVTEYWVVYGNNEYEVILCDIPNENIRNVLNTIHPYAKKNQSIVEYDGKLYVRIPRSDDNGSDWRLVDNGKLEKGFAELAANTERHLPAPGYTGR